MFTDHAGAGAPPAPPDDWLHAVTGRPRPRPERPSPHERGVATEPDVPVQDHPDHPDHPDHDG